MGCVVDGDHHQWVVAHYVDLQNPRTSLSLTGPCLENGPMCLTSPAEKYLNHHKSSSGPSYNPSPSHPLYFSINHLFGTPKSHLYTDQSTIQQLHTVAQKGIATLHSAFLSVKPLPPLLPTTPISFPSDLHAHLFRLLSPQTH